MEQSNHAMEQFYYAIVQFHSLLKGFVKSLAPGLAEVAAAPNRRISRRHDDMSMYCNDMR